MSMIQRNPKLTQARDINEKETWLIYLILFESSFCII